MRLKTVALALAGSAALAGLPGCGDSNNPSAASSARGGSPRGPARESTDRDAQGSSTQGPTVVAKVKLKNFKLAPKHGREEGQAGRGPPPLLARPGESSTIRSTRAPTARQRSSSASRGSTRPRRRRSIVYKNIPSGTHELEVYLANNDHTDTGVYTFVSFIVRGGAGARAPAHRRQWLGLGLLEARAAARARARRPVDRDRDRRGCLGVRIGRKFGKVCDRRRHDGRLQLRPQAITINAGQTVTWTNGAGGPHRQGTGLLLVEGARQRAEVQPPVHERGPLQRISAPCTRPRCAAPWSCG